MAHTHTQHSDQHHRALLQSIAKQAMIERGLLPTFSEAAISELRAIQASPAAQGASGAEAPNRVISGTCCGPRSTTTTLAIWIS